MQNRILVVIMMVLILVTMVVCVDRFDKYTQSKLEEKNIQAQIDVENERSTTLNKELKYYKSDEYVEKIAREHFGLIYPNEIIFPKKSK